MCDGQDPENDLIDWTSKFDFSQEVIFSLVLYFLIQKAIAGIANDGIQPVDISALFALAIQLQKRLGTLGDSLHRTLKYWVLGCRVFDLMGETSTTSDLVDAVDLYSCHGNVEFQNVEFAYSDKPVLRNISFDCRPGETVVFVGNSGGGKSTIRKLLFRSYLAQSGCIRIDGQDIRKLTKRSLRRHIGAVSQNPTLLNRTLLENLRFANERATDKEIKQMCRRLGFHATFKKLGYETNVGHLGSRLSGGQIMMVAITRIMIRGCKIAVFDEATGPFDHMTGEIFEKAIDTMKVSMTVIMIA
jgi:ABC-type multidrug transport system fused ATPase/permease subunit